VELMVKPEQATRLGGSARAAIVARFSVDRMVDETLDLYKKMTRTGPLRVKS
jgi:glycosyltransferase involved in cell wall biosynthesis